MPWYYSQQGQSIGPVEAAQLADLIRAGTLPIDTPVWAEGQPGWVPANQVSDFAPLVPMVSVFPRAPVVQFRCPYCSSTLPPLYRSEVSGAGWVLFWILLLVTCALLCWIGLLIRDNYRVCASCGMKLG